MAHFIGGANFNTARFRGDAYFLLAEFDGNANFHEAEFSGRYAGFDDTMFSGGDADFSKAKFSGEDASFDRAVFSGGSADFSEAKFSGGDADFSEAKFSGRDANFKDAQFGDDADFDGAKFSSDANFNGAKFSRKASFDNSYFNHSNLSLSDAENICILRLENATFENGSTICLNGTDFERLYVHWDKIEGSLVYNGETYLMLVNNFKNIEYFEDADDCYYQYRLERQARRSWSEGAKYLDALACLSCGYGVYPKYTLILSSFLVVFFGVIFWLGRALKVSSSTQLITWLQEEEMTSISLLESIYFSALVFIHTWPHPKLRPSEHWKYVVLIEDIVGWLLLALFLVTLGNVMIR